MTDSRQSQRDKLEKSLWEAANVLRGTMNSSEYQNYILGVIFYKYLSECVETETGKALEDGRTFAEAWANVEDQELLIEHLYDTLGFYITPENLYSTFLKEISKGSQGLWSTDMLQTGFNAAINSTLGQESENDFKGLFTDVNLQSPVLGTNIKTRSDKIGKVLEAIGKIDFQLNNTEIDVLGDAYEYLISRFASEAGKKGGEFYTPQEVSTILAKIVKHNNPNATKIYDPTCGSGSLLLRAHKIIVNGDEERSDHVSLYGQELSTTTYNLARMNVILHQLNFANMKIENGDTLTHDLHADQKFDAIVANPPYSANWEPNENTLNDPRFAPYGKLAPKSKADFAFVQHIIHHLADNATAAVVLPHGVLFRGGAEATIRKYLVEKQNVLDAVIGLPADIFYGTSISTIILVFKKNRNENDPILFVDASKEFKKSKAKNVLTKENINTIVETYTNRESVERFAHLVTPEEIKSNDYNLNIPRYISSDEPEQELDLDAINQALLENTLKQQKLISSIDRMLTQLKGKND